MKLVFPMLVLALIVAVPLTAAREANRSVRNFRAVTPGVFYRSGQMSPEGFERVLREHGIQTVISFRETKDEFEEEICKTRNVKFHRVAPQRWSTPEGDVPAEANVANFLAIVDDPATPRPILVHCFAGVHRTGAYVAIYRMQHDGWSNDDAIAEMLKVGEGKGHFESDQLNYLRNYSRR